MSRFQGSEIKMDPNPSLLEATLSSSDIARLVEEMEAAESVKDCLRGLHASFEYFDIRDYLLCPNDQLRIQSFTSNTSLSELVAKRIDNDPELVDAITSLTQTNRLFPFRLIEYEEGHANQNWRGPLQNLLGSLGGNGVSIIPIQSGQTVASLMLPDLADRIQTQDLLVLQAICTRVFARIQALKITTENLTELELSILSALARGRDSDEISNELGISLPTISILVRRINQELGVSTIQQAISLSR